MQQISGYLRRAVDEFNMIRPGENIAVALSGGKDSMLMLHGLKHLSRYHPARFTLTAIFIDLGFDNIDTAALKQVCEKLEVPLVIRKTDIAPLVFDIREESNPCALCAKMRRGAIHDAAIEAGCRTIALGHHRDDAVETLIMNLIYEGRIGCFQPVTYLDRKDVRAIRPMIYLTERQISKTVERLQIPIVKNPCPMDRTSMRKETKDLLKEAEERFPGLSERLFGAITRSELPGWKKD
ncbi:MAG: tRNA 2-thiocytidine biosynthesis protein TtcA [Clostridia bacterium]|nr:tRNA 2-thiocytidine biosynthesis protein TtcA [Clostridia bacterium]